MADFVLVQVLDAREDLLEELAGLALIKTLLFNDEVEKLAPIGVFHDEEELAVSLYNLVELDDIGVPHYLEDLYLTRNALDVALIGNFVLLENLDGNFLAR
jgi:hypothetical protein